jgi:hypothetical protein
VYPLAVSAVLWAMGKMPPAVGLPSVLIVGAIIPAAACAIANRRLPFNALIALFAFTIIAASATRSPLGDVIFAGRSFFGVSRVLEAADHSYRLLQHGNTVHGRQKLPAGPICQPQSYYDTAGPVGDLFARSGHHFTDVAITGLGSGGLACYAEFGSRWTFFEIDSLVERIAEDPALFTFLPNSRGHIAIAIGDGRKGIEAAAPGSYDLIVLDAFSSDSVPVHLLTKEAIDAYLLRLRPGGIAALHISNKYLDLEPVIGGLAAERRLPALTNADLDISPEEAQRGRAPTQWVVIASAEEPLASLRALPGWRPLTQRDGVHPWTDDYSNLLRSIRWR